MKEFDFDELDRAVNSLVNPPSATADSPATVNSNVDINTTPAAETDPVVATTANSAADSPTSTPVTSVNPSSIAERRRSGRFMDVVHPSSDMKTATNTTSRSREEIKVAPREDVNKDMSQDGAGSIVTQPDTAESNTVNTETSPVEATRPEPEHEPQITPELTVDETLNVAEGANSPFLADAKVEKRPLGAFSGENNDEQQPNSPAPPNENKQDTTDTTIDKPLDQQPTESQPLAPIGHDEADTPLPAELQDDLLSIESDTATPAVSDTPVRDDEPVGPTSITQQYKAAPSSNHEKPGEIYDTKAYHKALKGPAKKKSSWWLVVWIILLLVVGAGAGAAIYYFVLPAL